MVTRCGFRLGLRLLRLVWSWYEVSLALKALKEAGFESWCEGVKDELRMLGLPQDADDDMQQMMQLMQVMQK